MYWQNMLLKVEPIGISEYQLQNLIPESLKGALPSIEEIENELK